MEFIGKFRLHDKITGTSLQILVKKKQQTNPLSLRQRAGIHSNSLLNHRETSKNRRRRRSKTKEYFLEKHECTKKELQQQRQQMLLRQTHIFVQMTLIRRCRS